jgi:glutamate synthase (NADPH/NADH) small chain
MTDKTGFLKFPREAAHKQHARERIRHWHEYDVDVLDYWPEHAPEWHESDHEEEGCRHVWGYDTVAFDGEGRVSRLVLLAMGYAHPEHGGLVDALGLTLGERGNMAASSDNYTASVPAVFSCEDMRRGQSWIVWAIREGRQCARGGG